MIGMNQKTKKVLFVFFGIFLVMVLSRITQAVPKGGYAHSEILIQPEELKALIDKPNSNLRIIDIREKLKYLAGHIPGAIHIWRPDIEDKNHPLTGMMADQAQMEGLLGSLGISDQHTIVIYSDGPDNGRLWWILAYYGFALNRLKLLDGGLEGWKTKGYSTEAVSPKYEKAQFKLRGEKEIRKSVLCGLHDIKSALREPNKVVLDVRSQKEFLGEETRGGAIKPGRIPGVPWIEWKEVLMEEGPFKGYWKPAEEIRKIFSAKGVTPNKDIHIY
jgi:thiosulfate/3-mercaptopyruvate sulfurtransferase